MNVPFRCVSIQFISKSVSDDSSKIYQTQGGLSMKKGWYRILCLVIFLVVLFICIEGSATMDFSGYDGIDIKTGTDELNRFREDVEEMKSDFLNLFNKFNLELSELWASPKAVKYNVVFEKLLNFLPLLDDYTNELIDISTYTYGLWSDSQGETYHDTIKRIEQREYEYIELKEIIDSAEYGKLVGINPEEAKRSCEEFVSDCKLFIVPKLKALKLDTGIYDTGGEINQSIVNSISEFSKAFNAFLDDVLKSFDKKIKNEKKELRLSIQGTESVLETSPGQSLNHAAEP